jgi:hypothetical protein
MVLASSETLDDLDHFFGSITLDSTEFDQLTDSCYDCPPLRGSGHGDSSTSLEIQQHGVLVHTEHGCDVLGERETFSWPRFTFGNGSSDLCCHLVVESHGFRSVDVDRDHGTSHSSSMRFRLLGPP